MIVNGREVWIDVLRAFACICVILVHSPAKFDGLVPGQFILAPANYVFMAWGVSVFFMISGSLLFYKAYDLASFYKRRFSRILMPIVLWSIIYIFFDDLFYTSEKPHINRLMMVLMTQQTALLWFMYTLVGIYLLSPILSCWLSVCRRRDVEVVLGLWCVTLLLPYLELLDPDCHKIIEPNGMLYSFYGYVGYALLGYYIRRYINVEVKSWQFLCIFSAAFLFPIIVYVFEIMPLDVLNHSMSLSAVLMSITAFLFFKGIKYNDCSLLRGVLSIAKYSFGIYLCHMLFLFPLRFWLTQFHINYIIQIPLTAIIVGAISYCFVRIISKMPYSKFLLG